jgi:hypothetical protein
VIASCRGNRIVDGVPQNLVGAHPEKSSDLHGFQLFHLTLASEHAGNRGGSQPKMAGEVGLRCPGPLEGLVKPNRIHGAITANIDVDIEPDHAIMSVRS